MQNKYYNWKLWQMTGDLDKRKSNEMLFVLKNI